MAEQLSLQINVGGNVGESLGSLKKQLREAQADVGALADKFGATSQQAIQAAKRAAELKDRIGDAKALTDAFNPDAKFKALSSSLAGVAGGFAAVQGAIGLFGVESKEVEKTLLKVQSAMALSQGLQSIGESIDSFKQLGAVIQNSTTFIKLNELANKAAAGAMKLFGVAVETTSTSFKVLKGAIAATGIGLLVVLIGELVSAFQDYQGAAEKAKKTQDDLNKTIQSGAKTALQAELAFIEKDGQLQVARAKARGASEKEILEIENQNRRLRINAQKRYNSEISKIDLEASIAAENEVKKTQADIEIANLGYAANQLKARREANAKIIAEEKAAAEKLEAGRLAARKAGEAFTNLVVDNKEKERIAAASAAAQQVIDDDEEVARLFALEGEKQEAVQKTASNIVINNEKIKKSELDTYLAKKDIQLASIDLLYGLSNIFAQVAGKNKALQAAAIIAENAAGIGRIIINTQVANAKAAAMSPLTLGQPWVTINNISAGLGIASSLLATRKALGELGGGSAGSAPQLPNSGNAPLRPQGEQTQMTQLNQTSINALGNQAMRAYVVETDVTNSQQRIAAIQQRARFN